jgi:hypothetical protein
VINLLLFYFQQFQAMTRVLVAFTLLVLVIYYRQRFGLAPPAARLAAPTTTATRLE